MEPVTTLILGITAIKTWIMGHAVLTGILALAGITVLSWTLIVHQFSVTIIPLLRRAFGDTVANGVAMLIGKLDDAMTMTRRGLRDAWRVFTEKCLGWKTTFKKSSSSTVTAHSEAYVHTQDGKVLRRTSEEELNWEDVPEEIRHAFTRQGGRDEVVDSKEVAMRTVSNAAAKHGVEF